MTGECWFHCYNLLVTERHRVALSSAYCCSAAEGPDGTEQWWTVEKCKQRRVVTQGRILGVHQQCMEWQMMSVAHAYRLCSAIEVIQEWTTPGTPKLQESCFSKVVWSTISKAALKSIETSKIGLDWIYGNDHAKSLMVVDFVDMRVNYILSICSQRIFLLKRLRD